MGHVFTRVSGQAPLAAPQAAPQAAAEAPEFVQVFSDHAAYVLGLLRRLGVAEADLDDTAQEVFLVVHRALPGFQGRSRVKTWVVGICLRVVSRYRRTLGRRRETFMAAEPELRVEAVQPLSLERAELRRSLERALAQLPEEQRVIVVLHDVEEMSMKDVAEAVECPKFTAYTRLYAGRRKLKAMLSQRGVQP